MAKSNKGDITEQLVKYRKLIDDIDDNIHKLIIKRSNIAKEIANAKRISGNTATSAYRPSREASMLRRLKQNHNGPMPFSAIVRIWREIIASLTQMQSPYGLYICDVDKYRLVHDAGRFYYGASAEISSESNPISVIKKVIKDKKAIGLLPAPRLLKSLSQKYQDKKPWWRRLGRDESRDLNIIAALPFVFENVNNVEAEPTILVLAHVPFEPSGNDTTLVYCHMKAEIKKSKLDGFFKSNDVEYTIFDEYSEKDRTKSFILAINGYHYSDRNLSRLFDNHFSSSILKTKLIGGYANPIIYDEK